jgi:hypothetical protein
VVKGAAAASGGAGGGGSEGGAPAALLPRHLCQVGGLNQNYVSETGTLYHIQIEDRGPVMDAVSEEMVRRVNLIVYANYGEPNARIILGRDHDLPDVRSQEQNRTVEQRIQALALEARRVVEQKERTRISRIKSLIREYHTTKSEAVKKEFEEANLAYPFLFSRAWLELKQEKPRAAGVAPVEPPPAPPPLEELIPGAAEAGAADEDVIYPLDPEMRERVIEIERILESLHRDLDVLRGRGRADDILLQTCRKMMARARESICGREPSEFNSRRLEVTRNSLNTTWRQVQSRLKS